MRCEEKRDRVYLALSGLDDARAVGADEARLVLANERVLDAHPAQGVRCSGGAARCRLTCPAEGCPL